MTQTLLVIRDYLDGKASDPDLPFNDGNEGPATIMRTVIEHYFTGWNIQYVSLAGYAKKMSVSKLKKEKHFDSFGQLLERYIPDKVLLCGNVTHAFAYEKTRPTPLAKIRSFAVAHDVPGARKHCLVLPTIGVSNFAASLASYSAPGAFYQDFVDDVDKLYNLEDIPQEPQREIRIVRTIEQLRHELAYIENATAIAVDIETSNVEKSWQKKPFPMAAMDHLYAVGFGAAYQDGRSYNVIIPYELLRDYQDSLCRILNTFLDRYNGTLVLHNAMFDLQFLMRYLDRDFFTDRIYDTMLAAYLLDERTFTSRIGGLSLKFLSQYYFNVPDYSFSWEEFYALPDEEKDFETLYEYLTYDTHCTIMLYGTLDEKLREEPRLHELANTLVFPATITLATISNTGMLVDRSLLRQHIYEYQTNVNDLLSLILNLPKVLDFIDGEGDFNVESNKDLKKLMHNYYGLHVPNVDATTLENIEADWPSHEASTFASYLLRFRKYKKLLSTYLEPLHAMSKHDGRVHGSFLLHGTVTGRLSSNSPNLQNMPKTDDYIVRTVFTAPEDYAFVEVDYTQLEMAVMGILSQDTTLVRAVNNGEDLHRKTAAAIFGVSEDEVTDDQRQLAKIFNFGIIYGRKAGGIVRGKEMQALRREGRHTMDRREAQAAINAYMETYPGVADYMKRMHAHAHEHHYVESLFGRKRRFPIITSDNWWKVQNQAINMPDQSTAGDFTLHSLVRLLPRLQERYGDKVQIVNTVHDSILFYIHKDVLDDALVQIAAVMTKPPLDTQGVSINVDVDIGPNWGRLESYGYTS